MDPKELRKALQRLDKCELKVVLELINCLKRKQDAKAIPEQPSGTRKAARKGKS